MTKTYTTAINYQEAYERERVKTKQMILLLKAVKCSEFDGVTFDMVLGESWFDARERIAGIPY